MNAVVIFETLTGNTRRAATLIADALQRAGVHAAAYPITAIDYQAVADAELVIVGTWTDGLIFFGQRPGRAGRLGHVPYVAGKQCVVFCTYAIDPGKTIAKLTKIMEQRGGRVIGGMAIRRNDIDGGAQDFVDRLMAVVEPTAG